MSQSTYFILEEPELYLHPQAQRSLFDSLQELSAENQVLLCTHSSSFINIDNYNLKEIEHLLKVEHPYSLNEILFNRVKAT